MQNKQINQEKVQANRKLALTLGLIAVVFFLGVILRMSLLGR
jgi:hypothetical protein